MKKKFKNLLAIALSAAMAFGTFPALAYTAPEAEQVELMGTYGDISYRKNYAGTAITITGLRNSAASIDIPSEIDGLPVTEIAYNAFSACGSLKGVTIPDSVTSIGESAFTRCFNLTDCVIPNSVTVIGSEVFSGCSSLTSITVPDSVTYIGSSAFSGCTSLTDLKIGSSVYWIGRNAFSGCTALENINLPESVTSIGPDAFYNTAYYNNEANWEEDALYIKEYLIQLKPSEKTSYTIKDGTIFIADEAFKDCAALTNVTLPDKLKYIGSEAFSGCTELESISMPNTVKLIDYEAFKDTAYYSNDNNWEDGTLYLDTYLLDVKKDKEGSYTVKEGTLCIADYAFSECELLTDVIIPNGVEHIGIATFCYCKALKSITLPNTLKSMAESVFEGCEALESITLPKSLNSIGDYAFSGCKSLANVYYDGSEEQWSSIKIGTRNDCLTNAAIRYIIKVPTEVIAAPAITVSAPDENANVTVSVPELEKIYVNAVVYAVTDGGSVFQADLVNGGETTLTVPANGAKSVKVFVWNTSMQPITHVSEANIPNITNIQ